MSSVSHTVAEMVRATTYIERRVDAGLVLDDDDLTMLAMTKRQIKSIRTKSNRQIERPPLAEATEDQVLGRFRLEGLILDWRPRYVADPACRLRFRADSRDGAVRVRATSLDELVDLADRATDTLLVALPNEAA